MLRTERLIALRKEKGFYQKDIAKQFGIERSTYGKYETGDIQPLTDIAVKLASFFSVSIDYLFVKSDNPNPEKLIIPEVLKDVYVSFHRGEFEGLTQSEIDALAVAATALKAQRKL